jgi:type IV pilus assembly protein PilW
MNQNGLSLIELMVSLIIMMIVLAAVIAIYSSSRQTVRTQSGVSRMNERFNLLSETLSRDVRHAGFGGCPSIGETEFGNRAVRDDSITSSDAAAVQTMKDRDQMFSVFTTGEAGKNIDPLATANSPIIELRTAAEQGSAIAVEMTSNNSTLSPIQLFSSPGLGPGTYPTGTRMIISDCATPLEVNVLSVAQASPYWTMTTREPIIAALAVDARVSPVVLIQYFMGIHVPPGGGRSTRAIYRRTSTPGGLDWNTATPLVLDVSTMAINLGIDTDGDWDADRNVAWDTLSVLERKQVVSMQVNYTLNEGEIGGLDSGRGTGTGNALVQRSFSPWITIRGRVS